MEKRLLEASQTGNTQLLHQLLHENPLLLHNLSLSSSQTPLHVAAAAGHVAFAKEILTLRPDFAAQLGPLGFAPIHVAAANGHVKIVREMLTVDRQLSRLRGRNEWTPLHLAASAGRSEVIGEIVWACPESLGDVTVQKETALHVAVKNSQFGAVDVMVRLVGEMKKEEIVRMVDELGNTVLHLAVWRKDRQVVEWLLGSRDPPMNVVNKSGLTALDVLLIFPSEAGDREIEALLRSAGATTAATCGASNHQTGDTNPISYGSDDLVEYFKFKKGRDMPSEARTALLVIAVLVATATFQAGISPPSGVWQQDGVSVNGTADAARAAGKSILGSYSSVFYLFFVIFNSMGLSVSLYMLTVLTSGFPMHLEFEICAGALYFTYFSALGFMAPEGLKTFINVLAAVMPATMFHVMKLLNRVAKVLYSLVLALRDRSRCN